jgi:hypothetical protein
MQDAEDCDVSGEDANSNGEHYCEAENERHEERNHDQPPYRKISARCCNPGLASEPRRRGFFNLPALTLAAIDD